MDHFWTSLVTVATAIIGVAIIAVLVSNRAQTAGVIGAATTGLANDITAAVAPVSGASASVNTGGGGFGFTGSSPFNTQPY
jgi:PRD1 phage membrane DNA delivery